MHRSHSSSQGVPRDPEAHFLSLLVGKVGCCTIRGQIENHGYQMRKLTRYFHRILF